MTPRLVGCTLSLVLFFAPAIQAAPKKAERRTTIFLAGDVLLGRGVTPALASGRTNLISWKDRIQGADLAFCNLECALHPKPPLGGFKVQLLAPPSTLQNLQEAGFDIISAANNHALDNGAQGVELLQKASSLVAIGVSPTRLLTWPAYTRRINGQNITWLAATNWGPFQKGSAQVRPIDSSLIQQVRSQTQKGDRVIVSLHWGHEYSKTTTQGQRQLAHALIDAGAICVVGHHSHCVGPVETYKGRPIFYSLGNFVFDRTPLPQSGLAAMLSIQGDKVGFQTFLVNPLPSSLQVPIPLPKGETLRGQTEGHFLKEDAAQRLQWTQDPSGIHILRLFHDTNQKWRVVAQGTHPIIEKIEAADLDGDGTDDIWLQLRQRSKLDVTVRSRLHLYKADAKRGFRPLWRGSTLSRPFHEWALLPRPSSGTDLVALETNPTVPDFSWIAIYRWNGFGFRRLWDSPLQGQLRHLIAGQDAQGQFLCFQQQRGTKTRILKLRPTPKNSTQPFRAVVQQNWQ